MIQRILLISIFFLSTSFTNSSSQANKYIKSGERLVFIASFKMSGVMTDIAEIKMETSTVKTKTRELLRLKCTATTYASWDDFFKVRDLYESYVNPTTLMPSLFKRSIDEGGYKKQIKYLFKRKSGIAAATYNRKGSNNVKTEIQIEDNTLDIVSTIYKTRVLDYENMHIGQTISIDLIIDRKIQTAQIKYLGKETIKIAKYGSKECYKLSVGFIAAKELKKIKGNKFIWITADNNRLPALIKATIPVGSAQLRLSNFTNNL
ncbi:MAG: DUF3108 domain-containing protein [Flavobacteriaceae bacterium]|nr:DUF3108 domain-containing protein [Flavobacteriaceae bacterium]